jgi:hypothetical protein
MQRVAVGRIIGGTGAAAATLAWGIAVLMLVSFLLAPKRGFEGFGVLLAVPLAPFACSMFIASALTLGALAKRADRNTTRILAVMHAAVAVIAWFMEAPLLLMLGSLAVVATQIVALQMMPSQPSSQR